MKKNTLFVALFLLAFSFVVFSGVSKMAFAQDRVANASDAEPGMGGEDLGVGVEIQEDTTVGTATTPGNDATPPEEGTDKPVEGNEGGGTYDW